VYDRALAHHLGAHLDPEDARRLVTLLERIADHRDRPTGTTGAAS